MFGLLTNQNRRRRKTKTHQCEEDTEQKPQKVRCVLKKMGYVQEARENHVKKKVEEGMRTILHSSHQSGFDI